MNSIPENIEQIIEEFVNGVKRILGNNLKKLFYMVHMLEEIIPRILI